MLSDPQLHPVVIFRTVAEGLPPLPDDTLEAGTFCLVTDAPPPSLAILQSPGGVQAWDIIGGAGTPGLSFTIRYPIGTGATQPSTDLIPANAVILYAGVEIVNAYDGGTAMAVGSALTGDLALTGIDIDPTVPDLYDAVQSTPWGAVAGPVITTVSNAPVAGSGFVTVTFCIPLD